GDSQLGWFVIVYRDLSGPHAVGARVIVLTLTYAIGGMLTLGLVALSIMRRVSGKLFKGHTGAWLWPLEGRSDSYRELAIAYSILLGAGLAAITLSDGPVLWLFSVLLPLMGPGLWIVWLRRVSAKPGVASAAPLQSRGESCWTAASVLFVLCCTIPLAA